MPNLGILTSGQLAAVRHAVSYLLQTHAKHEILTTETWSKLDSFGADVESEVEDRRARDRRARVSQAVRQATQVPV